MRVVFAGTPEVAVPALERLLASSHEVIAVATRPDARKGRGRVRGASPVGQVAADRGIEVLKPTSAADPEFLDRLRELQPDCCAVVAWGQILTEDALSIPAHGWINLHFSVLPAWRGAAPVQHAIAAGDEVSGATTFRIVKELDAGPTFGVMTERIRPRDTAGDLLARLADGGADLLVQTLSGIESGQIEARPQSADGLSYAPKIEVADARIDWGAPAPAVDRRIRAMTPAPGAWTELAGARMKIGPVQVGGPGALAPGEIAITKSDVHVGTATEAVRLGEVQPVGKRAMPAEAWARGLRESTDLRFDA